MKQITLTTLLLLLIVNISNAQIFGVKKAKEVRITEKLNLKTIDVVLFSTDGTFAAATDDQLSTSLAIKTYVDSKKGGIFEASNDGETTAITSYVLGGNMNVTGNGHTWNYSTNSGNNTSTITGTPTAAQLQAQNTTTNQTGTIVANGTSGKVTLSQFGATDHSVIELEDNKVTIEGGVSSGDRSSIIVDDTAIDLVMPTGNQLKVNGVAPTANQILIGQADGSVVWGANSGGSTLWNSDTDGINYTAGNVGIGTNSVSGSALTVLDNTTSYAGVIQNNNSTLGQGLSITTANTSSSSNALILNNGTSNIFQVLNNGSVRIPTLLNASSLATDASGNIIAGAGGGGSYTFTNGLTDASGTVKLGGTLTEATTIAQDGNNVAFTGTGNVGFGVGSPAEKIHVSGAARFNNMTISDASGDSYFQQINSGDMFFRNLTNGNDMSFIARNTAGTLSPRIDVWGSTDEVRFRTGGTNPTLILSSIGRLELGTYGVSTHTGTPATFAAFTATGEIIERTAAELLADIGGGGSSPWSDNANGIHYNIGTNRVGVGVSLPLSRLHVTGQGNTTATFPLIVDNSDGDYIIATKDNGDVAINGTFNSFATMTIGQGETNTATSIGKQEITMPRTFAPTTGNATYTGLNVIPTINQTGTANGSTYGVNIDPTLTNATDWKAVRIANDQGYGIYQQGANALNYFAGNIGIGVATPLGSRLHINENSTGSNLLRFTNNDTGATGTDGFEIGLSTDESVIINQRESNALHIATNNTFRISVENDGDVGIGTNTPSARLDVIGDVEISGDIVIDVSNNVRFIAGTGDPNGSVTAGVGSTFSRTDGGVGSSFYVKETGTGNVGWIAK